MRLDRRGNLSAIRSKNELSAESGKQVIGIAPQVLSRDADSLISQNQ
jgi:hypothetical protein